jgi:hypothetical protein
MTPTCPNESNRQKSGTGHKRGLRGGLVMATALAGGAGFLFALANPAAAQTVLLAPKGSHQAPSADAPVYVGADLGQDAPSSLTTPPILSNPVSLAPNSTQTVAPVASAPVPAAPVPAAPTPAPTPSASADSTIATPAPSPAPLPPAPPVRQRVVIAADAPASPSTDSDDSADTLNAAEYNSVVRRSGPIRHSYAAGDAPRYAGIPAPAQPRQYDSLPENLRYQPKPADAQYLPRQTVQVADATPSNDAPLPTVGGAPDVPVAAPQRMPLYQPSGAALAQNTAPIGTASTTTVSDPLTRDIDRSIAQLRASLAPTFQASLDYEGHSGTPGESRLNTFLLPLEATFAPNGVGQMKLTVTPTTMLAGTLSGNTYTSQTFGQMAFGVKGGTTSATPPYYIQPTYTGRSPGGQTAAGAAVDVQYSIGSLTGDVGASPLGFFEQNVVGGLQWLPALSDTTNLRLVGERRAVTESFLSYGGAIDPYTGKTWGGVVRDTGRVSLETRQGLWNIYAMLGGSEYTGDHVKDNSMYEAAAGATYPVWRYYGEELRLGIDLHYNTFDKNLRYFTYGQGGYFSPQRMLTALIPITFHNQISRDLSYDLRGSVGYQQFAEKNTPYFPDDPALQAALVTAAASSPSVSTFFPGQRSSGITGGVSGEVDYRVSQNFSIGARAGFTQSGVYQEYNGSVFAKYIFNGYYDK